MDMIEYLVNSQGEARKMVVAERVSDLKEKNYFNWFKTPEIALVVGYTGSGKSRLLKDLVLNTYPKEMNICVVGFEKEYIDLAKQLGGKVIEICPYIDYRDLIESIKTINSGFSFIYYDGFNPDRQTSRADINSSLIGLFKCIYNYFITSSDKPGKLIIDDVGLCLNRGTMDLIKQFERLLDAPGYNKSLVCTMQPFFDTILPQSSEFRNLIEKVTLYIPLTKNANVTVMEKEAFLFPSIKRMIIL